MAEQKAVALYWADGAGTVTPPGHWSQIALDLIEDADLSDQRAAKVLATLNTAQADAFIACWDAKFTYWSERPVTAIRRELDAAWTSYIATPPFPGYVSGHSTTSAAASTVLAHFFPDDDVELVAMANEAAVSRLHGGIHFRSDERRRPRARSERRRRSATRKRGRALARSEPVVAASSRAASV